MSVSVREAEEHLVLQRQALSDFLAQRNVMLFAGYTGFGDFVAAEAVLRQGVELAERAAAHAAAVADDDGNTTGATDRRGPSVDVV